MLIFLLGAGYTLKRHGHVRVDVMYAKFTPRTKAWIDLAAALRLVERFGLNPFGVHWAQIRARDILLVDQDGKLLEGEVELSAVCIHAPVHMLHPRVRCVLHTHMPYATTLTAIEDGRLEAVSQNAWCSSIISRAAEKSATATASSPTATAPSRKSTN